MSKHPDDEAFTDDELREMEAAMHLITAQRHEHDGADEGEHDEKITKQEAHYRPGTTHRFCEACSMFLFSHHDSKNGDGECSLVAGNISPSALCDHYERKKERAAGRAEGGAAPAPVLQITPQVTQRFQRRLQNAGSDEELERIVGDAAKYGVDWSHMLDRASGGSVDHDKGIHYERVPLKGTAERGGFRLPLDMLNKLSREHGPREIGVMLKKLFDVDPNDPQAVPAHAVAAHGGHKVLQRFVRNLRSGRAQANAR
jgi:hypothetical protein